VLVIVGLTGAFATLSWVGYAIASGRNLKQRLTEPAPIVTEEDAAQVATS
jgi:hypothetical protein